MTLDQIKYQADNDEIMEWDNTMTQFRRLTLDEYKEEFGELPLENDQDPDAEDDNTKKKGKGKNGKKADDKNAFNIQ